MPPKVSVNGLTKRYGPVEAVRGVSFDVAEGEVFGLLGPNGAGKTSTLECIVGLRESDGGDVRICGLDRRREIKEIKQRIGVQLQATALQEAITVREAMYLFGAFYRKKSDATKLLERFGLAEKQDARFETLSGGQKQRLAVVLALLNEPEVLFLDEPTANLDPQSRREVHRVIRELKGEGRTVVITTHYIEEAEGLCDRVAVVDGGKVIAEGTPGGLIERAGGLTRVVVKTGQGMHPDRVRGIAGIMSVEALNGELVLETADVGRTVIGLVKAIEAAGDTLMDLSVKKPSLEDVFVEMTGRRIRD